MTDETVDAELRELYKNVVLPAAEKIILGNGRPMADDGSTIWTGEAETEHLADVETKWKEFSGHHFDFTDSRDSCASYTPTEDGGFAIEISKPLLEVFSAAFKNRDQDQDAHLKFLALWAATVVHEALHHKNHEGGMSTTQRMKASPLKRACGFRKPGGGPEAGICAEYNLFGFCLHYDIDRKQLKKFDCPNRSTCVDVELSDAQAVLGARLGGSNVHDAATMKELLNAQATSARAKRTRPPAAGFPQLHFRHEPSDDEDSEYDPQPKTKSGRSERRSTASSQRQQRQHQQGERASTAASTVRSSRSASKRAAAASDDGSEQDDHPRPKLHEADQAHISRLPVSAAEAEDNRRKLAEDTHTEGTAHIYCTIVDDTEEEEDVFQLSKGTFLIGDVEFTATLPRKAECSTTLKLKLDVTNTTQAEKFVLLPVTGEAACSVTVHRRDNPDQILHQPHLRHLQKNPGVYFRQHKFCGNATLDPGASTIHHVWLNNPEDGYDMSQPGDYVVVLHVGETPIELCGIVTITAASE
eukprot:TRINITY_DN2075_c0_g1_i4.p1 TRINITY_DN2075_c0_g1~~TRINITY_DN2075_c0_g1_i4.p1  ORF type:complete len:528 (+),score=90.64 TRINITY_DN2075_c0_g1_i4:134-1717(+)